MRARYPSHWTTRDKVILIAMTLAVLAAVSFGLFAQGAKRALGAAVPPQVTAVSPLDDAHDCPLAQVFTVTFDQDMDVSTIRAGTLYILKEGGVPLPATVTYDATSRTAVLTPTAKLEPDSTYYVTLTVLVRSAAGLGVSGAPLIWHFHTVESLIPHVVNKSPAAGATGLPQRQKISVTFDTPMDPSTFTPSSFYFAKRGGAPLPATFSYDEAAMTATLTPATILDENTTYDATITSVVRSLTGNFVVGTPITWSFTTIVVQPPAVVDRIPADGATEVALDVMVVITFDRNMNQETVTPESFYIQRVGADLTLSDPLRAVLTCNENVATLTPAIELNPDTTYKVTLTDAVKSVKGASVIGSPISWTFKTKQIPLPFSDVPVSHPYFTAIFQLAKRQVISGFADGSFRPSNLVTRQQFAKMIVRTLGYQVPPDNTSPFTDIVHSTPENPVDPQDPLFPDHYIAAAYAHGIIAGKTATTFAPYDNITRFQAVTMVVRALDDIDRGLLTNPPADYQSTWNPSLSPEHGQNARLAEFNGLLEGLPLSELNPLAPMTRGEIAQLEWNLVEFLE
ncbi:MAG: Ig-like domain-containing protein [Actinobacteria bacterium]|nr:Ig-like domain-containing protein [Actinomycetota bacterium]